jgi:hypothetical protein
MGRGVDPLTSARTWAYWGGGTPNANDNTRRPLLDRRGRQPCDNYTPASRTITRYELLPANINASRPSRRGALRVNGRGDRHDLLFPCLFGVLTRGEPPRNRTWNLLIKSLALASTPDKNAPFCRNRARFPDAGASADHFVICQVQAIQRQPGGFPSATGGYAGEV